MTTPLARAKAYIRGEGWTIRGNSGTGYHVFQITLGGYRGRWMTTEELIGFGGIGLTPPAPPA